MVSIYQRRPDNTEHLTNKLMSAARQSGSDKTKKIKQNRTPPNPINGNNAIVSSNSRNDVQLFKYH